MDVLRDWRLSYFENEGMCRAGIRSALCLQGYGWLKSDREAESIVADGLRRLGAVRPTWEQGQREYVDPDDTCKQCAGPLSDEQIAHHDRFCSAECAKIAITRRAFENLSTDNAHYRRAAQIIRIAKKPKLTCAQCGNEFQQRGENGKAKFCSESCYQIHVRTKTPDIEKHCAYCGGRFMAKLPTATYCSDSCKTRGAAIRRGVFPKRISPPVFDYVFRYGMAA
jgi:endogenous inhibitor of DNA gyrase (YacG/DUF329 family)